MSPIAKIPLVLVSNFSVSTGIWFLSRLSPQSATGPSFMVSPKKRKQGVALKARHLAILGADACCFKAAVLTMQFHGLADDEIQLACIANARILLTESGAARNSSRR